MAPQEIEILQSLIDDPNYYYEWETDENDRVIRLDLFDPDSEGVKWDNLLDIIGGFSELEDLSINFTNINVGNLWPLKSLIKLKHLSIEAPNNIEDLLALSEMEHLELLTLQNTAISDLTPLIKLKKLIGIYLTEANISDISPLRTISLTDIYLEKNKIIDIGPLSEISSLQGLNLSNNYISDFSSISNLKEIVRLSVANNPVAELSFLSTFKNLHSLNISGTKITDISVIARLEKITSLWASHININALSCLSHLITLKHLNISNCGLNDVSFITNLVNLESLYLNDNLINDLPVKNLTELRRLSAGPVIQINLLDIGQLSKLKELTLINSEISDLSFLANLLNLNFLNLADNKITDINPLKRIKDGKFCLQNNLISEPVFDFNWLELDLRGNSFGNKLYQRYEKNSPTIKRSYQYINDCGNYYYEHQNYEMALAIYNSVPIVTKKVLIIYWDKLKLAKDSYYIKYYAVKCTNIIAKLDIIDEEVVTIIQNITEIVSQLSFYGKKLLIEDLANQKTYNYSDQWEYIQYLQYGGIINGFNAEVLYSIGRYMVNKHNKNQNLMGGLYIFKLFLIKKHPLSDFLKKNIIEAIKDVRNRDEREKYSHIVNNIKAFEVPSFDLVSYYYSINPNHAR